MFSTSQAAAERGITIRYAFENIENKKENTEMQFNNLSKSVFALGAVLLVALGIAGWYIVTARFEEKFPQLTEVVSSDITGDSFKGEFHYTIPGVPYVGVHNHVGKLSYINSDADGAVASILEYWNPGEVNFADIFPGLQKLSSGSFIQFPHFKSYIESAGDYVVKLERLDIRDIKKYVNSDIKTPLLFLLPVDEKDAGVNKFHPATVLIGIDEPRQTVTVHSFWLGNNYEIGFEDFEMMQKRLPAHEQNVYFVIQPKSFGEALKSLKNFESAEYRQRGTIMNESKEMLKKYLLGWDAYNARLFSLAEGYYKQVVGDPRFEKSMPPYLRVSALYELAHVELLLGKIDVAKGHALRAIEQNHDLDKSFGDWPGYEFRYNLPSSTVDRISIPYRVLGDIYSKLNDSARAEQAYENAIAINAKNFIAVRNLRNIWLAESRAGAEVSSVGNGTLAEILVRESPWRAVWGFTDGRLGTFKLSFTSAEGGKAAGKIFDSSAGSPPGELSAVALRGKCVSFIFSGSDTRHEYCITQSGSLEGTFKKIQSGEVAEVILKSARN